MMFMSFLQTDLNRIGPGLEVVCVDTQIALFVVCVCVCVSDVCMCVLVFILYSNVFLQVTIHNKTLPFSDSIRNEQQGHSDNKR